MALIGLGLVPKRAYMSVQRRTLAYMDVTERPDELAVTAFRSHLSETVDEVERVGRRVYLTKAGRRVAAVVPVDLVKRLDELTEALEEAEDRYLAERAMAAKAAQGDKPYKTLEELMDEYTKEHGEAVA
jgi:prevent-host-death family protein